MTIGLQLDVAQIVAAPLAVLGWLLALVPLKMGLNFLALRATACRRSTPGAQASCWGMAASLLLLLGMVMQQHFVAANVVQTDADRAGAEHGVGAAPDPTP